MAYHAWGAFTSPLLIALLVTAERVARAAGLSTAEARRKMLPILRQTLANYAKLGPAGAFSGPIVRGDAQVVRQHLKSLKKIPEARAVYVALARAGVAVSAGGESGRIGEAVEKVALGCAVLREREVSEESRGPSTPHCFA